MNPHFTEAIKLKDGVIYNLPYHQNRMDRTLAKFGGTNINLSSALSQIPDDARDGLFKCRVIYDTHIIGIEYIPYVVRQIKTVKLVVADDVKYDYKYVDRSRLNELVRKSGCDDIIIIKNGLVTDAFASNLVFESSCGLFTPDTCLLSGTKRQSLLDAGIIRQKRITVNDITNYDRVRFISAMIDLGDNVYIDSGQVSN